MAKTGGNLKDFDKVILYAPDVRRHQEAMTLLGLDAKKMQNPFLGEFGSSGSAQVLLQLIAALEEAGPGQRFLVINYGDGADALTIETTEAISGFSKNNHRGVCRHLGQGVAVSDYYDY